MLEIESRPGATRFEDIQPLVQGAKGKELFAEGDLERDIWSAGMVVGLVDDIPSCEELIQRIVADAEEIISDRLAKVLQALLA